MIVLDASAVVELVLGLPGGPRVATRISNPDQTLHAPHLLSAEVPQVIRRFEMRGDIDTSRGVEALADFVDMDVSYYEHLPLMGRVWDLRQNMTSYDALYVALAEALDATLVTTDRRWRSVPGVRAAVDVIVEGEIDS